MKRLILLILISSVLPFLFVALGEDKKLDDKSFLESPTPLVVNNHTMDNIFVQLTDEIIIRGESGGNINMVPGSHIYKDDDGRWTFWYGFSLVRVRIVKAE